MITIRPDPGPNNELDSIDIDIDTRPYLYHLYIIVNTCPHRCQTALAQPGPGKRGGPPFPARPTAIRLQRFQLADILKFYSINSTSAQYSGHIDELIISLSRSIGAVGTAAV